MRQPLREMGELLNENAIWKRTQGVSTWSDRMHGTGHHRPDTAFTGLPHDLRKASSADTQHYEFDVIADDSCDALQALHDSRQRDVESMKIVEQCLDNYDPAPTMISDRKLWPADLRWGRRPRRSPKHIAKIMGSSMEALITTSNWSPRASGCRRAQVYVAVESPW